jgi:hypothetical protein
MFIPNASLFVEYWLIKFELSILCYIMFKYLVFSLSLLMNSDRWIITNSMEQGPF